MFFVLCYAGGPAAVSKSGKRLFKTARDSAGQQYAFDSDGLNDYVTPFKALVRQEYVVTAKGISAFSARLFRLTAGRSPNIMAALLPLAELDDCSLFHAPARGGR